MPTLEQKLDELIAREEHVSPEEVDLDFIRRKRESEVYPEGQLDFTTRYGGFNRKGLRILSGSQARSLIEKAYAFLARFAKK